MRGDSEGRSEEPDDGRASRRRPVVYRVVQYLLIVALAVIVALWLALNA